jgi:NitT/TauT family transport system substrate-binding protein
MRRSTVFTVGLLTALVMLTGVGAVAARPTSRHQQLVTVHVGVTPIFTSNAVYLGIDKGFFQQQGLNVVPTQVGVASAIVAAIVSGSLDYGICGNVVAEQAVAAGLPIRLAIPDVAFRRGSAGEAVLASSSIRSPKDLEGKTFAVTAIKSSAELSAKVWIAKAGGDPSKVTFIAIPSPQMISALESGRVDAADLNDPVYTQAKTDPKIRFIGAAQASTKPFGQVTGAWCASSTWLNSNTDTARRFNIAMLKANAYTNAHAKEARAEYVKFAGVTPEVAQQTSIAIYPSKFNLHWLQYEADQALKYGYLTAPLNVADLLWQGASVQKTGG